MPRHAAPKRARRFTRKTLLAFAIVPLLLGGVAYAYFNANYGLGHVDVENPPSFTVSIQPPAGTPLSPGSGSEVVGFTLINQLGYAQTIHAETYSITTDPAGGIYDVNTNAFNDSCDAVWFTLMGQDGGTVLPVTLQPGQSIQGGTMTVTMPANATVNESACAGVAVQVEVADS